MDPRLGRTVLNFRIEEKLGEGSYGVVYRARHVDLDREVAIKILRPEHSRDRAAVQRFLREARLVCSIGHPAIVQVENSGMLDDEPFYVMELVSGRSLARRLADDGPLTVSQLAFVFGQFADALEAAHGKGVIHRDLKPHNIMIAEEGDAIVEMKLFDFGIAKLLDSADSGSQTGGMMGTPHFMAPEQARDAKNVDERADVYGFGATFFAAATGHRPFEGDSVTEVLIAVQQDEAPPLSRFLPSAPPALTAIVDRCLAKDPADRPRSVRDAADAIITQLRTMPPTTVAARGVARPPRVRIEAGATMTSGPTGETGAPAVPPAARTLGSTELKGSIDSIQPTRGDRRWRRRGFVLAAVAMSAAAATLVYVNRRPGDDSHRGGGYALDDRALTSDARMSTTPSTTAPADAPPAVTPPPAPVIDAAPPPDLGAQATPPDGGAPVVISKPPGRDRTHKHPPPTTTTGKPPTTTTGKPPVTPTTTGKPPVTPTTTPPPPSPPAVSNCARSDFAAVYDAESPSPATVRAAIRHLNACHDTGMITDADFDRYKTALVAKW